MLQDKLDDLEKKVAASQKQINKKQRKIDELNSTLEAERKNT